LDSLVEGTLKQQRLLAQSPKTITKKDLEKIFLDAIS